MTKENHSPDSEGSVYNESYVADYRQKEGEGRIERLLKYIDFQKDDEILDIGCGLGFLYQLTREGVKSYTGLDESVAFIEACQREYGQNDKKRSFIADTLQNFVTGHKGLKFDKIFLIDVSEHLTDEELSRTLNLCSKILKEQGKVFIHTPNGKYFLEILKQKGVLKQTVGHIAVRDQREYEALIKESDLGKGLVETKNLNHYLWVLKPFQLLSWLPFIGNLFRARLLTIITRESHS